MLMPAGEVCPTVVSAPLGLGEDITSNGVCCACYRSASCVQPCPADCYLQPIAILPSTSWVLSTHCLSHEQADTVRSPMSLMHYCDAANLKRLWHGITWYHLHMAWTWQVASLLRGPQADAQC